MFDRIEEYRSIIRLTEPLLSQDIPRDYINRWILDTEHGLLHGFLVGYFAFENAKNRGDYLIELVASSLVHDFYRCHADKYSHDEKLAFDFVDLLPDTYTHRNPSEETDLIVGDRIELRRYPDWKEWSAMDITKYKDGPELDYFYRKVRPEWDVHLWGLSIIDAALCLSLPSGYTGQSPGYEVEVD